MARSLGTLTLDLIAKIGGFVSGMTEAEREADKRAKQIKKNLQAIGSEISDLGKMAGVGFGVVATAMVYMTKQAVDAVDTQADMAAQLGTTYDSLNTVAMAAKNAGVDLNTVNSASLKLNDTIGSLASGAGGAGADALTRLGLSAEQLSSLELDQQISLINSRISEVIPAAEQASVAVDLFGKSAGAAILQINPERLAEAARQAEIFGLNLSEVDTAEIGAIGDTLDTLAAASQGFFGQLGLQFAPLIRQVGLDFVDAADKAGGFGKITESIFQKVIRGAAYVANAVDGVSRVFSLVLDTIIGFAARGGMAVDKFALRVVKALDKIPGLDLGASVRALENDLAQAEGFAELSSIRIKQALEEPLAGEKFLKYVEDAKKASQEAAKASLTGAGGKDKGLPTGGDDKASKDAADKAAKAKDAEEKALRDSLRRLDEKFQSEAEKLTNARNAEQEILDKSLKDKLVSEEEYTRLSLASEEAYQKAKEALQFSGLDRSIQGLRDLYTTEQEALAQKLVGEQNLLAEALEGKRITEEEYAQLSLESKAAYEQAITDMETKAADDRIKKAEEERAAKTSAFQGFFGNLSTLMNSESRKAFELGKAAALAGAIVDGIAATVGAYKTGAKIGGPVLGAAFAAAAAAATMVQIQKIRSQKFGGGSGVSSPGAAGVTNTQAVNAATEPVANRALQRQNVDITLKGSSRFTVEEVAKLMEDFGERMADSGGRVGKVTVVTT